MPKFLTDVTSRGSSAHLEYNACNYGLVGDASTDNSAALTNLITNVVPANGGIIYFPAGTYHFSSPVTGGDGRRNILFRGAGGRSAGALTASTLRYTGSTGPFLSFQNTYGMTFRDLQVVYNNASFTGRVFDFRNVTGSDTAYISFENCHLSGVVAAQGATMLDFDKCIFVTVSNTNISYSAVGISGHETNSTYCNAVYLNGVVFHTTALPIRNPGSSWLVNQCSFEGTSHSPAQAAGIVCETGVTTNGLTVTGCYAGDVTTVGTWFKVGGSGISFIGNDIAFGDVAIDAEAQIVEGLTVIGNRFGSNTTAIKLKATTGTAQKSDFIQGNVFSSVGTKVSGILAPSSWYTDGSDSATLTHGLDVLGKASQAVNLFSVKNNSGVVQSRFNKDGYFGTLKNTAPADGDITTSEGMLWWDNSVGSTHLKVKGKDSAGTVVSHVLQNATDVSTAISTALAAADGNGLTESGGVLAVGAGTGISVAADAVSVDTSVVARKYTATLGAVTGDSAVTVTHSLSNKYVTCQVYVESTGEHVLPDLTLVDTNSLTLTFAASQASGYYRVVVTG